eukprot:gene4981-34138_t
MADFSLMAKTMEGLSTNTPMERKKKKKKKKKSDDASRAGGGAAAAAMAPDTPVEKIERIMKGPPVVSRDVAAVIVRIQEMGRELASEIIASNDGVNSATTMAVALEQVAAAVGYFICTSTALRRQWADCGGRDGQYFWLTGAQYAQGVLWNPRCITPLAYPQRQFPKGGDPVFSEQYKAYVKFQNSHGNPFPSVKEGVEFYPTGIHDFGGVRSAGGAEEVQERMAGVEARLRETLRLAFGDWELNPEAYNVTESLTPTEFSSLPIADGGLGVQTMQLEIGARFLRHIAAHWHGLSDNAHPFTRERGGQLSSGMHVCMAEIAVTAVRVPCTEKEMAEFKKTDTFWDDPWESQLNEDGSRGKAGLLELIDDEELGKPRILEVYSLSEGVKDLAKGDVIQSVNGKTGLDSAGVYAFIKDAASVTFVVTYVKHADGFEVASFPPLLSTFVDLYFEATIKQTAGLVGAINVDIDLYAAEYNRQRSDALLARLDKVTTTLQEKQKEAAEHGFRAATDQFQKSSAPEYKALKSSFRELYQKGDEAGARIKSQQLDEYRSKLDKEDRTRCFEASKRYLHDEGTTPNPQVTVPGEAVTFAGKWSKVVAEQAAAGLLVDIDLSTSQIEDQAQWLEFADALSSDRCRVRTLVMSNMLLGVDGGAALGKVLAANSTLKKLVMQDCGIGELGGVAFAEGLGANQSVTSIDMCRSLSEVKDEEGLLGPKAGVALGNAFKTNSTLVSINLNFNKLGDAAGTSLGNGLRDNTNTSIEILNLEGNDLGKHAGIAIAQAVKAKHCKIVDLNMKREDHFGERSKGGVGPQAGKEMGIALTKNTTIKRLDMSGNQLGEAGAKTIGKALSKNATLEFVFLSNNDFGQVGGKAIGAGMAKNTSVVSLDLNENGFGEKGGVAVGKALARNTTLRVLQLSTNGLGDASLNAIAEGLSENMVLEVLVVESRMGDYNIFTEDSALSMLALVAMSECPCGLLELRIGGSYNYRDQSMPVGEVINSMLRFKNHGLNSDHTLDSNFRVIEGSEWVYNSGYNDGNAMDTYNTGDYVPPRTEKYIQGLDAFAASQTGEFEKFVNAWTADEHGYTYNHADEQYTHLQDHDGTYRFASNSSSDGSSDFTGSDGSADDSGSDFGTGISGSEDGDGTDDEQAHHFQNGFRMDDEAHLLKQLKEANAMDSAQLRSLVGIQTGDFSSALSGFKARIGGGGK